MKGYFHRLMQQTGMTVRPVGDVKPGYYNPAPMSSEGRHEITPIHVEERTLNEAQVDQATEKTYQNVRGDAESPAPSVEDLSIQDLTREKAKSEIPGELLTKKKAASEIPKEALTKERVASEILKEAQNRLSEKGKLTQQQRELEKPKFAGVDRDIQTFSENSGSQHEIRLKETSEEKQSNRSDTTGRDYAQYQNTSSDPANQVFKEDIAFKHTGAKSDERAGEGQIRQVTLKDVREWIAGTPDKEEARNHEVALETINIERTTMDSSDRKELPAPQLRESYQKEEPEIHDFHLSIGTISLTIEEPQKAIQTYEPPRRSREEKSGQESPSSRLSRHYIRVR
ncbi:MAG: hypothetical protein GY801_38765 [bacterium]|nr:hypothetical protein [bacterium]